MRGKIITERRAPLREPQGFPGGSMVKNLPADAGDTVQSLIWENPTCYGATKTVGHS